MKEIIKNILNRLNNKNKRLCLYDPEDKSVIIIDKDLLIIIRKYYENQLISIGKETLQYPCRFIEHAFNDCSKEIYSDDMLESIKRAAKILANTI